MIMTKYVSGRKGLKTLLGTASAFAIGLTGTAIAQDDFALDTIIVTAQKRSEDIKDVPISVATMGGEKLDVLSSGGVDIRFLSARVPSLQVESSFGRTFPRFYMRGLGNTDFDLNASQPVSFVYDDIVLENPTLKGLPLFDMDQVEVLRGPQGTLFGRNTPAGVVKVASANPTDTFEAYSKVSLATYNTLGTEAAISGPINDKWSMRVSGTFLHRDDWVDNQSNGPEDELGGYDDFGWRTKLAYDNDGPMTALFDIHGWGSDGTARLFRANIIEPGSSNLVSNFERDEVNFDGRNKQKVRGFGATAKIEYELENHTFTSITGHKSVEVFSRGDIDGGFGASFLGNDVPAPIPFDAESADGLPEHDQFTQEFRFASNDLGAIDYQVGYYYFKEELEIESLNFASLFGGGQNGAAFQEQDTEAWAVFGNVNFEASDQLTLQAGLRYSEDEKDFSAFRNISPLSFFGVPHVANPADQSSKDDFVSWDLSATYDVNDGTTVFGRVATAHRAPSFQGRLLFGDVITKAEREEVLSYEAGVKSDFAEGRGEMSLTGFMYTIEDQQLTAVGGGANFNQLVNADETEGYGFEFDARYAASDNAFFTAGVSYNHTEIKDENLFIAPCGGGCTVLDPAGAPGLVSIDGNSLPHAPEWIANMTARFSKPMAGGGEVYMFGDIAYESEKSFFLYESAEFNSDSFTEVGLRAGWLNASRDTEVALFSRNLFNEEQLRGGIDFNNLTGFVNEPRIVGFEVRRDFN